jgi:hypothetical protein
VLIGLKVRNGFGEKDLVAAVGTVLHRSAYNCNCDDWRVRLLAPSPRSPRTCGVSRFGAVYSACAPSSTLAILKLSWPPICTQSLASRLHNERK